LGFIKLAKTAREENTTMVFNRFQERGGILEKKVLFFNKYFNVSAEQNEIITKTPRINPPWRFAHRSIRTGIK